MSDLVKPVLKEPFPDVPEIWADPISGFKIPKRVHANIEWRAKVLKAAEQDVGLQQDLLIASAQSPIFWFNAFAMTFCPKVVDKETGREINCDQPHVPFVTWAIQDGLINSLTVALKSGNDLLIDKSRQMGASWVIVAFLHHLWLFKPDCKILELSRIEDYVDKPGNMKALFQKHDYINQWLPAWMRPPQCLPNERNRIRMHIGNCDNNSVINGEATTKNAARGDTRTIVLLDEFSAVENGVAMRKATRDVSACRIVNGTAKAGSEFSRWATSGMVKVFDMPWYEHPWKGRGRYVRKNELTDQYEVSSPWYEVQEAERDPKNLAEEVNRDHQGAGSTFFDNAGLKVYKAMFGKAPIKHRKIDFVSGTANDKVEKVIRSMNLEAVSVIPITDRKERECNWRFWKKLVDGRPDQSKSYVMGIDISKGQGASNSTVAVYCAETKEKVAEYANPRVPPHEFARIVVAASVWFGGRNPRKLPLLVWEANGDPGIEFGRMVVKIFKYPYYYKDEAAGTIGTPRKKKKYGFHSNAEKKAELLGEYSQALAHNEIFNFSIESIDEAMTYIVFDNGNIGPAVLLSEKTGARLAHGDRVIADALAKRGMRGSIKRKEENIVAPPGSFEFRRREKIRTMRRKTNKYNWQFDMAK